MLDAFKLKPFDLEPVFTSWPDAPRFLGKPKKDLPVDQWLEKIKEGCIERKVPKEVWHKVGQHFMGDGAKARLDELKAVMSKVHGESYRWNWKKFKLAMMNMGWNISSDAQETLKVRTKSSGSWWVTRKKDEEPVETIKRPEPLQRKTTSWIVNKKTDLQAPAPVESSSSGSKFQRPIPKKSKSDGHLLAVSTISKSSKDRPPVPTRSGTMDGSVTTIAHAPLWLLNATEAMEILVSEHPKVMSTLSAILITVGSIPAIPAIASGAGGALLASGAAHTVGAIAVGVGSWIKAQQHGKVETITDGESGGGH